ncbi:MAG: imidazolonepropionase [Archangiaceae bacterium]|nr:imidazolonepropionase [Archangiaceae bacterium]
MFDLVIRNTSEVVTCDGQGRPEAVLAPIPRGAVAIKSGRIAWLGPEASLPPSDAEVIDARGSFVGPGLVDPHTHLVFGGERSAEFEQRCEGKTYLEIAERGGGIKRTVEATRAAPERELAYGAVPRLVSLLSHGVTTAEAKSGYGLEVNAELKMLRAIRSLDGLQPVKLIASVLPLHTRHDGWLEQVIDELLPRVAEAKLAKFCDAFVEKTAFTADETRRVMAVARGLGLIPRMHVDQLTAGAGAELAAELGSATADHLEHISEAGIAALARSGTVAVLAPTSTLFLRERKYAPGRALADAGVPVALCTNCNPGSSMTENVALVMALACLECGLTPAEAYLGFTRHAARALQLPDAGRLFVGGPADVVVYQCTSYRTLPYHLGVSEVRQVLKDGLLCWELGRVVRKSQHHGP